MKNEKEQSKVEEPKESAPTPKNTIRLTRATA